MYTTDCALVEYKVSVFAIHSLLYVFVVEMILLCCYYFRVIFAILLNARVDLYVCLCAVFNVHEICFFVKNPPTKATSVEIFRWYVAIDLRSITQPC
jgi:hypothetical protein